METEEKLAGFNFGPSAVLAADCDGQEPVAIFRNRRERQPNETIFPETYEEFLESGVSQPAVIESVAEASIGCENYQRLVRLGRALPCKVCPVE